MINFEKIDDLYKEYSQIVSDYLRRFISENEAQDLTQEVFMKVNKSFQSFKGKSSIKTWIYKIASNTLKDYLKSKQHKSRQQQVNLNEEDLIDNSSSYDFDYIEKAIVLDEMNRCIRDFIYRLPFNYSSVLVLSDLEGYKANEIAKILDISLSSVKIRLHRARRKLKSSLSEGCNISLDNQNNLFCEPV